MTEFDMGAYATDVASVLSDKSGEQWVAHTGATRWVWHVTAPDGATYALAHTGRHLDSGGSITATAVFDRHHTFGGDGVSDEWWRENDYQVVPNLTERSEKFSVPATKILKAATLAGRILAQVSRYREEIVQCGRRLAVELEWQARYAAAVTVLDNASGGTDGTFGDSGGYTAYSGTYKYFQSEDDVRLTMRVPHDLAVEILAMIKKRKNSVEQ